jgi:hypothetical protein
MFCIALARSARRPETTSSAPNLILIGGGITAAFLMLSFAVLYALGLALIDHYAVSTIAALDALGDGIGYNGWVAIGLVTAGVALAGLRDKTLPRWLGWVSAVSTVLFALLAFFPVVAWFPGLLWLLVAGVGLLIRPPQPA